MLLVERLTRVAVETLVYEVTVTDPETWSSPWTASVPLRLNPEPMFEYACHEGNQLDAGHAGWYACRREGGSRSAVIAPPADRRMWCPEGEGETGTLGVATF